MEDEDVNKGDDEEETGRQIEQNEGRRNVYISKERELIELA